MCVPLSYWESAGGVTSTKGASSTCLRPASWRAIRSRAGENCGAFDTSRSLFALGRGSLLFALLELEVDLGLGQIVEGCRGE
jgi:hypothetical protein